MGSCKPDVDNTWREPCTVNHVMIWVWTIQFFPRNIPHHSSAEEIDINFRQFLFPVNEISRENKSTQMVKMDFELFGEEWCVSNDVLKPISSWTVRLLQERHCWWIYSQILPYYVDVACDCWSNLKKRRDIDKIGRRRGFLMKAAAPSVFLHFLSISDVKLRQLCGTYGFWETWVCITEACPIWLRYLKVLACLYVWTSPLSSL